MSSPPGSHEPFPRATEKIADLVATIRTGTGYTRYAQVGSILRHNNNDESKGPGFTVVLDSFINLAELQPRDGSVFLSSYHPKKALNERTAPRTDTGRTNSTAYDNSDIPF